MKDARYTAVQHSAYGYGGDPTFMSGLESRCLDTQAEVKRVAGAGGMLFPTYEEAEAYCEREMYEGNNGLLPHAPGTFSDKKVDDLRIYVPRSV